MQTKILSLVLFILISGCNRPKQDDKLIADTKETSDSSVLYDPAEAIWIYDYNVENDEFEITQLRPVDNDTLRAASLEKIINASWPRVQVKFIRVSNDTAYIAIPDSKVLTQQMGSSGAESFMITTTYHFTELKGIKYVSFYFEEGDHAMPGVYNRNSWDGNRIR